MGNSRLAQHLWADLGQVPNVVSRSCFAAAWLIGGGGLYGSLRLSPRLYESATTSNDASGPSAASIRARASSTASFARSTSACRAFCPHPLGWYRSRVTVGGV